MNSIQKRHVLKMISADSSLKAEETALMKMLQDKALMSNASSAAAEMSISANDISGAVELKGFSAVDKAQISIANRYGQVNTSLSSLGKTVLSKASVDGHSVLYAGGCSFDHGTLSWKADHKLDPMSFNACARNMDCVPIHATGDGDFSAQFPPGASSYFVKKMWDVVDWSKVTERTWHPKVDKSWTGCDVNHTWLNQVVCNFDAQTQPAHVQTPTPVSPDPGDMVSVSKDHVKITWSQFQTILFVGDSNMKRLFDSAIYLLCQQHKFQERGKLHQNALVSCNNGMHLRYLFSAGRPGEPNRAYQDTSKLLKSIPSPSNTTMVVFNSGHNYLNLTPDKFRDLAMRMRAVVKDWPHYLAITSPALVMEKVKPLLMCSFNNVVIQKKNQIWYEVFPRERIVDWFWSTLQGGKGVDFIHFSTDVYVEFMQRIVKKSEHESNFAGEHAPTV